ncbi:MAG: tRNA (cytidine(34)-2'-O)-methyltransferase, partial [Firmicutes bacterium]|nr:tRNA (cytidine(34)-2'-O)-methyltransferase [Bacillota bacterium]
FHTEVKYSEDSFLFFGKETAGLPKDLLKKHEDRCIRIPMRLGARSLNLSNSVAIVVYEALRQLGFPL